MSWIGALYIDTAFPFRLQSAPKIFTALADAAVWIIGCARVALTIHYLDDFLATGTPTTSECPVALGVVMDIFS